MKTFHYETTSEAYDCTMAEVDGVSVGDTLVIKNERVVGIATAWPIAVTVSHGHLHTANKHLDHISDIDGLNQESIKRATVLAVELGYYLAPYAK